MADAEAALQCDFSNQHNTLSLNCVCIPPRELDSVGLTDPAAQCLEIPLLWPSSQAIVVDFAEDAGLDAGAAMWALSVACVRGIFSVSIDGPPSRGSRTYIAACASGTPRMQSQAAALTGQTTQPHGYCLCA